MSAIKKAYAISDAKISFVSLVNKAANKRQFIITKAEDGEVAFSSFGKIIKADTESHYVTGIVYEPMVEDSQGNYMTEDEIIKAAHWFAKNGNNVDLQHCFERCDNVAVVESFVAKSDMEIEGEPIKKGTWIMTAEITDDDIWDSVQKGEITGFSMGGVGVYSDEDVDLDSVQKSGGFKGLVRKLAKACGMETIEKGAVKSAYNSRVKEDNFYSAWYALHSTLEGNFYNPETGMWEWGLNSDENAVREALTDFNEIVTRLLTSDTDIIKSLEKSAKDVPKEILKAGKTLSAKNLETLQGINNSLSEFLSGFSDVGDSDIEKGNSIKKEDTDYMKPEEVQKVVAEEVKKAMEPISEQVQSIVKSMEGEDSVKGGASDGNSDGVTAESIAKMVGEEVKKAMEPITKAIEPIMDSRALPGNLNYAAGSEIKKQEEPHYMTGIF